MELEPGGFTLLEELSEFLVAVRETNETPANVLPFSTVTLHEYRLEARSAELIISATDRLYAWEEPDLPNDLCLMAEGRPFVTRLANERSSYLSLTTPSIMV